MMNLVLKDSTDSKVHGVNMGPLWVLSAPDGTNVGPMNLAIKVMYDAGISMQWWTGILLACIPR